MTIQLEIKIDKYLEIVYSIPHLLTWDIFLVIHPEMDPQKTDSVKKFKILKLLWFSSVKVYVEFLQMIAGF